MIYLKITIIFANAEGVGGGWAGYLQKTKKLTINHFYFFPNFHK